jgi:hypothetical protein
MIQGGLISMAKISQEIQVEALRDIVLDTKEHERKDIIEYVEWQSNKGRKRKKVIVKHLELVKSEVVFDREHSVWDVHTNEKDGRWWVITSPTNLYSQTAFPSLDTTLSLHIGIAARLAARQSKTAPEDSRDRFIKVWRRWENAADAVDSAKESEDYQAIGMMCRETLIELVKTMQPLLSFDAKTEPPKSSDFCQWVPLIVDKYAAGKRNAYIRGLLKNTATEIWQLVNWVTHTTSAHKYEASLALEATSSFVGLLSRVVIQFESGDVNVCPKCNSYQIDAVFEPDMDLEPPYVNVCQTCGWNNFEERQLEDAS